MTTRARSGETELVALRKLAEELARGRKERPTTGHLLAAIAQRPCVATDLLQERMLDGDVLLKAARVVVDDSSDAITRAVQRARDFASRSVSREPSSLHLLYALCQERTCAAHRAIEQCGIDVSKLRTAALQVASGLAAPRRMPRPASSPRPPVFPASPSSGSLAASAAPKPAPVALKPLAPSAPAAPLVTPAVPKAPVAPAPRPIVPPPAKKRAQRAAAPAPAPMTSAEARFQLDPKMFPLLAQIGKNLTLAAAEGALEPSTLREAEIERTLDVLAKRHANSACLVGAPGVGKTSVIRGIARRIAARAKPSELDDRILLAVEPSVLLAGTQMRGQLAERMAQLVAEVKSAAGRVVLVFEEIHALFAEAAGDEGMAELKAALASGEVSCIGTSTREEYRRVIEADGALARRFSVVEIEEPTAEEAIAVLETVAPLYEGHHRARYAREAMDACVRWSVRYLPGRALPDKSVSVLDLAGARARRRDLAEVGTEQVAEVVSELAGVPLSRLLETDRERMLKLESFLAERIVGHTDALGRIASVLRRNASGLRARRPIGSFLLLGPTGVGKTETAKAIADALFHSPDAMARIDLSEYAEPHAIARLVGAPPGYVGHEAGGYLTEIVRRRPYQVVLLDEIEKAHRDVLEAFLQVFDEGRLTDGRGRTVDFTNTVILLTSNLGADVAAKPATTRGRIGFGERPVTRSENAAYGDALVAAARSALPPELYNRLDEVLAFAPLTREDVAEVARRMIRSLGKELEAARGIRLEARDEAVDALLDDGGFDPELGARPMRRAIARRIEAPLAEMLLRGELHRGDLASVTVSNGALTVVAKRKTKAAPESPDRANPGPRAPMGAFES